MSIDVKDAVKYAVGHAHDLYKGDELRNLLLEEVKYDGEKNEWIVVLGFDSGRIIVDTSGGLIDRKTNERPERVYKYFHINDNDGAMTSMTMN